MDDEINRITRLSCFIKPVQPIEHIVVDCTMPKSPEMEELFLLLGSPLSMKFYDDYDLDGDTDYNGPIVWSRK